MERSSVGRASASKKTFIIFALKIFYRAAYKWLSKQRVVGSSPTVPARSQALMVKHTALTRKNTDRYRGGLPNSI